MTPLLPLGGGFEHLRGWVRYLDHDRFAVTLTFASPQPDEVERRFAEDGPIAIREVPFLRTAGRLFVPAVASLRRLVAEVRPHVLHSVFIQADILTALANTGHGIPHLSSVFGYLFRADVDARKKLLYRFGYAFARRRYKQVTAISEATARELRTDFSVDPRKIVLLRSGVDLARMAAARGAYERADGRTVAVAAQLIPEKQVDLFLRAFARVAAARPDVHAVIAGDGPERARLERLAAELHITDRARFLGEIRTVPALVRSVDVVVCAARPGFDGVPRVVLEAMAGGPAVVTTNVGGVAEVVRNGIDGIVLDRPGPDELSTAMSTLLDDAALRDRLSANARERVQLFDVRREVEQLSAIYTSLAST